jgi:hypothetical protein
VFLSSNKTSTSNSCPTTKATRTPACSKLPRAPSYLLNTSRRSRCPVNNNLCSKISRIPVRTLATICSKTSSGSSRTSEVTAEQDKETPPQTTSHSRVSTLASSRRLTSRIVSNLCSKMVKVCSSKPRHLFPKVSRINQTTTNLKEETSRTSTHSSSCRLSQTLQATWEPSRMSLSSNLGKTRRTPWTPQTTWCSRTSRNRSSSSKSSRLKETFPKMPLTCSRTSSSSKRMARACSNSRTTWRQHRQLSPLWISLTKWSISHRFQK